MTPESPTRPRLARPRSFVIAAVVIAVVAPAAWLGWHQHQVDDLNAQRAACIRITERSGASYVWTPETGCLVRHWDGSLTPLPIDVSQVQDEPTSEPTDGTSLTVTCVNGKIVAYEFECGDDEHPDQH